MYRIEIQTGNSRADEKDFEKISTHEFSDLEEALDFFTKTNLDFLDGSAFDDQHLVEVSYDEQYNRKVIFYNFKNEVLPTLIGISWSLKDIVDFPRKAK